jgi:hexosaminidase
MVQTRKGSSKPGFGFILSLLFLSVALVVGVQAQVSSNLMPLPAQAVFGTDHLPLESSFSFAFLGYREPRLERAVRRAADRLTARTGVPLAVGEAADPAQAFLQVDCRAAGRPVQTPDEDESYALVIDATRAVLRAPNPLGILRGLETLQQLLALDSNGFYFPAIQIQDAPRFPWRGLLIDVCRHWMPAEVIRRNLDAMAAVKLNVLHWHLSEDQGFRVESKKYPRLHELGSDGDYYSQAEIRAIIDYARDRGIRVVPEFDMPGHSTSWLVGYPELASAPGPYEIERHYGVFKPAMDPTREGTYKYLDGFIGEMARLFPDPFFHIGGDEVEGSQWEASPSIQAFKAAHGMKSNEDLQAYFNKRVQGILKKHGKRMVGWDEILHEDLPRDIVVQSWRGQGSLARAARLGFGGILSSGYYLDLMGTAAAHYAVDPLESEAAVLSEAEKALILGGEACMWSELVTPETVDSRIWPRMAAIAERFWSPQGTKDAADMYRRLEILDRALDWTGVTHRSNYPLMIERLAGPAGSAAAVRLLADFVEPVRGYARHDSREYTQTTPLNRLVDAARPESFAARAFAAAVDEMLADAPAYAKNRREIRHRLMGWKANHEALKALAAGSVFLAEVLPLSERLAALSDAGLAALQSLESGQPLPAGWLDDKTALFQAPEKPACELELMVVEPIRKIAEAIAGKSVPSR